MLAHKDYNLNRPHSSLGNSHQPDLRLNSNLHPRNLLINLADPKEQVSLTESQDIAATPVSLIEVMV